MTRRWSLLPIAIWWNGYSVMAFVAGGAHTLTGVVFFTLSVLAFLGWLWQIGVRVQRVTRSEA